MSRIPASKRLRPALLLAAAACTFCVAFTWSGARADETVQDQSGSQVRRLTESQYRATIADVFGNDVSVVGRFPPDLRIDGLLAVGSAAVSVNPASLEQYQDIAANIAAQVTGTSRRDRSVGCAPSVADPKGVDCARAFFSRVGLRLFRRPLTESEVSAFAAAATRAAGPLGSFDKGLSTSLTLMLTSPQFLFRIDRAGRNSKEIDAFSKASRLSFLLWNTAPDEILLAAAASGELDDPQGRARQVDRMLRSPRFVDGMRAFFTDYLRLDGIEEVSKDNLIYPAFTQAVASTAREQVLRTITHILIDQGGDFRDLFTSRAFAMHRSLGPVYDIPVSRTGWYIHQFPEGDPRIGLLAQAGILAQHSHPGRTSPTLRGLALNEIFLCEKVPSPPANVNFAVVQDVNNPTLKTTRARLQAHLDDEECASCHRRTDPMGLGLEQFDGAGQFRTVEHGEKIDVSGTFEKRPFNGAAELGKLFHDSGRVSECFARTAWRYANGRNPAAADSPAIASVTADFSKANYSLMALMRAVALAPELFSMPQRMRPGKAGQTVAVKLEHGES